MPDILHIEGCNFVDEPTGGQLTFSRQLMKVFGNRLALAGWANTPDEPLGCWFNKTIDGVVYRYFAFGRVIPSDAKPLVPARITTWFQIKRYQNRIYSIGIPNIIVSEHSVLLALKPVNGYNLCFCNPGVASVLSISRYFWAKTFSKFFDCLFFQSLGQKANCILAAADESAISDFRRRAGEPLRGKRIVSFPTRIDTDVFHPADRLETRKRLGLPANAIIAVTVGRIHWAKGWRFLLESFGLFQTRFPKSLLVFLGDGAERELLEKEIVVLGLQDSVVVAGYQSPVSTATYLQSADLFVMGSLKEGWSTALVEALACHVPTVTTPFSSADTIVRNGINGFVVDRDTEVFSQAMEKALSLSSVGVYADSVVGRYALKNLARDLLNVWDITRKDTEMQKAFT